MILIAWRRLPRALYRQPVGSTLLLPPLPTPSHPSSISLILVYGAVVVVALVAPESPDNVDSVTMEFRLFSLCCCAGYISCKSISFAAALEVLFDECLLCLCDCFLDVYGGLVYFAVGIGVFGGGVQNLNVSSSGVVES